MRTFLSLVTALVVSACASTASNTISESNGRVLLADSHIGEDYDAVMSRAAHNFAVEPQCEERRVSLQKQRKAFLYEICGFVPQGHQFSQAPLSEVVYHFIGRSLVRVDLRAEGESKLLDSVTADMSAIFGSSQSIKSTLGKDSYQWTGRQHVAGVRAGGGASAGNVHVRLLDHALVDNAPWLAKE